MILTQSKTLGKLIQRRVELVNRARFAGHSCRKKREKE